MASLPNVNLNSFTPSSAARLTAATPTFSQEGFPLVILYAQAIMRSLDHPIISVSQPLVLAQNRLADNYYSACQRLYAIVNDISKDGTDDCKVTERQERFDRALDAIVTWSEDHARIMARNNIRTFMAEEERADAAEISRGQRA